MIWMARLITSDGTTPIVSREPGEGDGGRRRFGYSEPRLIWWN